MQTIRYTVTNYVTLHGRRKAVCTIENSAGQRRELFIEVQPGTEEMPGTYEGSLRLWSRTKDGRIYYNVDFMGQQVLIEPARASTADEIFGFMEPSGAATPAQAPKAAPDFPEF